MSYINQFKDLKYLLESSEELSKLDLKFKLDSVYIEVLWFRAMQKKRGHWVIKEHSHSTFELHIARQGSCKVILKNSEFIIKEGEFYITTPGLFHEQQSNNCDSFIEYCINFDLNICDRLDNEVVSLNNSFLNLQCENIKDTEDITTLFEQALKEAKEKQIGYYNIIKSIVYTIAMKVNRAISKVKKSKYEVPLKYRTDEYRLEQIKEFIKQNCKGNIRTSQVSLHLNLSEKQVCRIVKQNLNITTKQLINEIRLKKSKELLKSKNLTVKQVSYLMGFSSEYYFNQFFKNMEGYPPGRYNEIF